MIETQPTAVGDDHSLVVERIRRVADATIRPQRSRIDFSWALHIECFVRPFVVELI